MRRCLVVAHQTRASPELLEAMKAKASEEDTAFHLLVPIHHGEPGLTWTEGHDRAMTKRRLEKAELLLTAEGLKVSGEVGSDSPVDAVEEVLRRDGPAMYAGIIASTVPPPPSEWLKIDVPSRIQRQTTTPSSTSSVIRSTSPSDPTHSGRAAYFSSSYLNDRRSLVRKVAPPPSSRSRSCSTTSATRT